MSRAKNIEDILAFVHCAWDFEKFASSPEIENDVYYRRVKSDSLLTAPLLKPSLAE